MKIYDIIIICFLILFGLIGFKRGFFKSFISCVGFILVIVLAYMFKNIVGDFFVLNLPFISFKNFLGGASTLNIILYQAIAFLLMLIILGIVYKIIIAITGIFEKILKMTIILGIPSKILGLIFGVLEGYVILYLIIFFLHQPFIKFDIYNESDYSKQILEKTPVISDFANQSLSIINEIKDLSEIKDNNELDLQIANLILKDKVVSKNVMQKLVDKGKITIAGIEEVLNKYDDEVQDDKILSE